MLGQPGQLVAGLATSIAVGPDDPGLPAAALFFQYSVQCQPVAGVMVSPFRDGRGDVLHRGNGDSLLIGPHLPGARSATAFESREKPRIAVLAGDAQGLSASRNLDGVLFGQYDPLARKDHGIETGWNIEDGRR